MLRNYSPHNKHRQEASELGRADGANRHYYEMCALAELRVGLRAGDVWVAGSRRYKDLQDLLLPAATWQELRAGGVLPRPVPAPPPPTRSVSRVSGDPSRRA